MGPAAFIILTFLACLLILVIVRAFTSRRTAARFSPSTPGGHPAVGRPSAVYEIDTWTKAGGSGGVYVGYGFDPHQRIMRSHRRAAWFARAVTARRTLQPDRVDWYASDEVAHTEEIRRIREYHAAGRPLENKILYREGAA